LRRNLLQQKRVFLQRGVYLAELSNQLLLLGIQPVLKIVDLIGKGFLLRAVLGKVRV